MTTTFSQAINGSLDTAVASASLNALTNTSYVIGAAIDNRPSVGSVVSYDLADLIIVLSSGVTLGTGNPTLPVWILEAIDGGTTNYAFPNAAAAAPVNLQAGQYQGVASATSVSVIVVRNLLIGPYSLKVLIQNNLGVTLPATNTSTCQLQRKTMQNW